MFQIGVKKFLRLKKSKKKSEKGLQKNKSNKV